MEVYKPPESRLIEISCSGAKGNTKFHSLRSHDAQHICPIFHFFKTFRLVSTWNATGLFTQTTHVLLNTNAVDGEAKLVNCKEQYMNQS